MKRSGAAAVLLSMAVAAAVALGDPGDDVVRRLGKTIVQYKDEVVQVVVGYRHANSHLDSDWILLDTYVTAIGDKPVRVDREDVALVLPGGTRMSLPSQKKMAEGIPDIRRVLREAAIARDPAEGYFVGREVVDRIGFFAVPSEEVVYDQFTVDRNTIAEGYLYFHAPEGKRFEPGRYKLEIFNKTVDVKLPFDLPASDLKKGRDKDKTVPW